MCTLEKSRTVGAPSSLPFGGIIEALVSAGVCPMKELEMLETWFF
jgi:hypothetical protein